MALGALDAMAATSNTLYFEDLRIGQRASLVRTVLDGDLRLFAGDGSDPIPLSEAVSAGGQFGQRIAHGMFTAGLVSALLATKLPGPGAIYLSQTIQFLAPVGIGDGVTANVEVVELVPSRRRARLFCECICDGRPVLEGEAWVAVESRIPHA
jgi:3-hydroxybutyryl-CoA dehydratase